MANALLVRAEEHEIDAAGENITIKLVTEPAERSLLLEIPYHRISRLMCVLRDAASLAAQAQQHIPYTGMAIFDPYVVHFVQGGSYPKTGRIALHFQTSEGFPLAVAMDREVAEMTISLLRDELTRPPGGSSERLS